MRAGQNLKDRRAVKLLTASKVALLIAPSEVGKCGKCASCLTQRVSSYTIRASVALNSLAALPECAKCFLRQSWSRSRD